MPRLLLDHTHCERKPRLHFMRAAFAESTGHVSISSSIFYIYWAFIFLLNNICCFYFPLLNIQRAYQRKWRDQWQVYFSPRKRFKFSLQSAHFKFWLTWYASSRWKTPWFLTAHCWSVWCEINQHKLLNVLQIAMACYQDMHEKLTSSFLFSTLKYSCMPQATYKARPKIHWLILT